MPPAIKITRSADLCLEVGGGLAVHELVRALAAGIPEARVETGEVGRGTVVGGVHGSDNGEIKYSRALGGGEGLVSCQRTFPGSLDIPPST